MGKMDSVDVVWKNLGHWSGSYGNLSLGQHVFATGGPVLLLWACM